MCQDPLPNNDLLPSNNPLPNINSDPFPFWLDEVAPVAVVCGCSVGGVLL